MKAFPARRTGAAKNRAISKTAGRTSPAVHAERRGRPAAARMRMLGWKDDPRAPGGRIANARGGIYTMRDADGTGRWVASWHPNDEPGKRRGRKFSVAFLVPAAAAEQACEEHFLERQTNTGFFDGDDLADPALSGPATAWKRARR